MKSVNSTLFFTIEKLKWNITTLEGKRLANTMFKILKGCVIIAPSNIRREYDLIHDVKLKVFYWIVSPVAQLKVNLVNMKLMSEFYCANVYGYDGVLIAEEKMIEVTDEYPTVRHQIFEEEVKSNILEVLSEHTI